MSFPYIFKNIPTSSDVTADDTFKSLGRLGYTGSLQDRVKKWLADEGFEGSLDDRLSSFRSGAVFTPASLFASGEDGAWYDPSDLSTLSQTSTGTLGNVSVGDPVGYLGDKSGNGNHATQATAAARPVLRQTGEGSYYLEFDGIDDRISFTIPAPLTPNWTTVFAVDRKGEATASNMFQLSASSGANDYIQFRRQSSERMQLVTRVLSEGIAQTATAAGTAGDLPLNTPTIVTMVARDDTTTHYHQLNQGPLRTVASNWPAGSEWGTSVSMLQSTILADYGQFFTTNRLLTPDEMNDLQVYMASKAGVTL